MRPRLVAALTGLLAALVAALAVATNLATPLLPDTWRWARDPLLMWGVTIVLMVAVVVVSVVLHVSSRDVNAEPSAVNQHIGWQYKSASVAWNTGVVINAPVGVVNMHPTAPAELGTSSSTPANTADSNKSVVTSPAKPQGTQSEKFPRIESVEDSLGNRPYRVGNDLIAPTDFVLTPGQRVVFLVEASDPKGEDVVLSVITPASQKADVSIRGGQIIWSIRSEDIADPAYIHIYLASRRECHRHSGSYDDACSFIYRILPSIPEPEQRILVSVSPEYLAGLFDEHTSMQAQKLADAFIGKWMKVSGPLGNVGSFTSFSQVTFASTSNVRLYMLFRDRLLVENRLSLIQKGQQITVVGRIARIEPYAVQLESCELVSS